MEVGDAGAAAGELQPPDRVLVAGRGGGGFHPEQLPGEVQLLGQEHGQGGVDALTHLGFGEDHGDQVIRGEPEARPVGPGGMALGDGGREKPVAAGTSDRPKPWPRRGLRLERTTMQRKDGGVAARGSSRCCRACLMRG